MRPAAHGMSAVRMVLGPGIMYTANTVSTFVGAVSLMLFISPRLTLLALVPLALVSILVRHYGRKIHDRFEEVQAQLSNINALVQENLAGARGVRAYAQEAHEEASFDEAKEQDEERNHRGIRLTVIHHLGVQYYKFSRLVPMP